jgi:aryl-alcohol dehydrogenase-like predicted oxidoreductase
MKKRKLGKNGPELSVLGLGTWSMGGPWRYGWGPVDDKESLATIHCGLDHGINWIDTAASYGLGHAEKITGQAIQDRRDKVYIATKCGIVWNSKGRPRHDLNPGSIRQEVEASLDRLQTDYIDLYQIHWPDPSVAEEKAWKELVSLKKQGKVRWIGVSNFNLQQLQACEAVHHIDSLQPPYNMLRRQVEEEILPFCLAHGIGVVAYSPLASGLLTGYFDITRVAEDDWRLQNDEFRGIQLENNIAKVEKLGAIAKECGVKTAVLALAYVLKHKATTSAIVGSRRVNQLLEALAAADQSIAASYWIKVERLLSKDE